MIATFKSKKLKQFYETGVTKGVAPTLAGRLERLLDAIEDAAEIDELDLPGFYLHMLRGKQLGYWSVRVNKNWRLIFRFEAGYAYDIELIDYH